MVIWAGRRLLYESGGGYYMGWEVVIWPFQSENTHRDLDLQTTAVH